MTEKESTEPLPGARLCVEDFAGVVRLTPLVAIDLIVRDPDGRILLGLRTNEPARGSFFVPGGRITKNETCAAAFRRITLAELGVERSLGEARFLGVYEHIYAGNFFESAGFGTHYVVLGHELNLSPRDLVLPADQHGDYVWKTEVEILAWPAVHENTRAYFQKGVAGSGPAT